jgi:hypothetical protein
MPRPPRRKARAVARVLFLWFDIDIDCLRKRKIEVSSKTIAEAAFFVAFGLLLHRRERRRCGVVGKNKR